MIEASASVWRLAGLVVMCLVLSAVETGRSLFPATGRHAQRVATNLALALMALVVNVNLSIAATTWASRILGSPRLLEGFPYAVQLLLGLLALDLSAYLGHVALHRTRLGWRLHRVHHGDPDVDVTTALRQHPGETLWRIAFLIPAVALLQIPASVVAWYLVLSAAFSQLEHANVRWGGRVELLVRKLFVTPHMHKWHHSRDVRETDTNYGNILSVWDRAFGTFTGGADPSRVRYGLDGLPQGSPHSLVYLLRLPFAR